MGWNNNWTLDTDVLDSGEKIKANLEYLKAMTDALAAGGSTGTVEVRAMQNTPPASPTTGYFWIVGANPTGVWIGHANALAYYAEGSVWAYRAPNNGSRCYYLAGTGDPTKGYDIQFNGQEWIAADVVPQDTEDIDGGNAFTIYGLPDIDGGDAFTEFPEDTAGALIYFGNGLPSATLGKSGDVYIRLDGDAAKGNMYQQTAGTWSYKMNLRGPAGEDGADSTVPGPAGSPGVFRIDKGTTTAALNATYGTTGLYKSDLFTVTFAEPFPDVPVVDVDVICNNVFAANPYKVVKNTVTASGFTAFATGFVNNQTVTISWSAKLAQSSGSISVSPTVVSLVNMGIDNTGADYMDTEIQAILDNYKSVFIDPGFYRLANPLVVSGQVNLYGAGSNSTLFTDTDIPVLRINCNNVHFYKSLIDKFCLQARYGGNGTIGIEFYGSNAGMSISYNIISNLWFEGTHTCMSFSKVAASSSNGEAGIDWNTFDNLKWMNYGSNQVQYGMRFMGGSGTGNLFGKLTSVAQTCALAWEAYDGANVGDIVIEGLQCGGGGTGLFASSGAAYRSRMTVLGWQFDAGLTTGFNIASNYSFITIGAGNLGGGVTNILPSGAAKYFATS